MGTSDEAVMTDKLGRRSGPRRKYSIAEKRSMVEETQLRGASVPEVAQRHGVNANLLSVWRRLYRQGLLVEGSSSSAALLPVTVDTPTVLPTQRTAAAKPIKAMADLQVEVQFAGGQRLHLRGALDRRTLRELIDALSSR
jgi:transposase-like protein